MVGARNSYQSQGWGGYHLDPQMPRQHRALVHQAEIWFPGKMAFCLPRAPQERNCALTKKKEESTPKHLYRHMQIN